MWEACIYDDHRGTYGELSDMVDTFHAANQAAAGVSGEALNFSISKQEIGVPDEYGDPYFIGFLKSAKFPSSANYAIEDYINKKPPNWEKCI
jgi:hypothetical protein